MEKVKSIEVLNSLITINNDRIERYKTALKETEEPELQNLFAQFISTSLKCKQELIMEVHSLGGKASKGTLTSGKLFRIWMDVKVVLTSKVRNAILNSCEFGDDMVLDTYDKILENEFVHLSEQQLTLINAQKTLLKSEHDHVIALCNELEYA